MNNFVTPNDKGIMADTDSRSINNAVKEAIKSGIGRVVIPRINERTGENRWDVDEAILLSSNLEIILDNCYIRQMDGSMDNVFRNINDPATPSTVEDEDRNIVIRGRGNAVIDGGKMNDLCEATSCKDGLPHVEKNNVIRLYNVRGLKLQNFTILNQRWWAINLYFVEEALISGLTIITKPNGLNQDGIDLRVGCNNIIIENIYGQSGDDFIALSGFWSVNKAKKYNVIGKSIDIHDIVIKNIVATSTECAVIALRNHDGVRMYNITIDTVHDVLTSEAANDKNPRFDHYFEADSYKSPRSPYATVRIGQDGYISQHECQSGDVFGLHVTNIHGRLNNTVMLNETIENSYFGNIYADNDVDCVITAKTHRPTLNYGADLKNVVFENVFYNCRDNENSTAFDFPLNHREHTMQNVVIRNAFIGNAKTAINMGHKGCVHVTGLYSNTPSPNIIVSEGCEVILDGKKI